ncbi:hypothetical protein JHD50_00030 [Sulfurimonas sp. MAG313]|nr:hypothetical protein [Sulfurimonas sp. MAG313]MDF1879702.1 hypothetical protein [Sulfurimonas sp. MAG313]
MIRSIHPLYFVAFMGTLLVILIWQNTIMNEAIVYEQSERANARVMAKRIIDLKKLMKTANKTQIDRFLDGALFAGAELTHRVKSNRYIIEAKNMSGRQLQSFLNHILNLSVKVMQLKVDSKDEKHVRVYMEISL